MSKTLTPDDVVEELTQIKEQMLDLIENVRGVLKAGGFTSALDRAEDYWIAHLTCAISHDHGYLGGSGWTLQDTIEEIESGEDEEEDIELQQRLPTSPPDVARGRLRWQRPR
ncbi:hypothetical protein [Ralstonia solanacearum]|uniref:hypothetical protein n=1 Tax=Ralstonia solanacearum TaxID=305 RepID=UPI000181742C|nr:hypothetical protein [Ralstonia solanacearum]MDC6176280.1 hypothetical protein [Ralstonia solanacearum]MDC6239770.1 hypothetical protein [Ralstonia solanacearum]